QPVKSLRTVSPRSSVTAVHAAQRYHHVWNPGVGDGLAHRCSILSPCSRPGANRGIPEDGGRCLIFLLGMEACIDLPAIGKLVSAFAVTALCIVQAAAV